MILLGRAKIQNFLVVTTEKFFSDKGRKRKKGKKKHVFNFFGGGGTRIKISFQGSNNVKIFSLSLFLYQRFMYHSYLNS